MKITIEISNEEDARRALGFLSRLATDVSDEAAVSGVAAPQASQAAVPEINEAPKPLRKPRADAGKKREPYGPRNPDAGAGASASSTPTGGASAAQGGAAAAGATSAAEGSAATSTAAAPAPVTAAGDFPLTAEGAKAALIALSKAPGKGTEACLKALAHVSVPRLSELKPEHYAPFIAHIKEQLAK